MKVLELFAGSQSISNAAKKLNMQTFSVDIIGFKGIDLVTDIEYLKTSDIPFIPDIIWASPPCQSYSIAAISHHRNGQIPISNFAKKTDSVIKNTLDLIRKYKAIFYIENPVGMLRKMSFMQKYDRVTITYCQYGDNRMKPTDIWSNNIKSLFNPYGWQPKVRCKNGDNCHESAPRGSHTGTQGKKNAFERSKIPKNLCLEILSGALEVLN